MWSHENFNLALLRSVESIYGKPCHPEFASLKAELQLLEQSEFCHRYFNLLEEYHGFDRNPEDAKKDLVALCSVAILESRSYSNIYVSDLWVYILRGFQIYFPLERLETKSDIIEKHLIAHALESLIVCIKEDNWHSLTFPLVINRHKLLLKLADGIFESIKKHNTSTLAISLFDFLHLSFFLSDIDRRHMDFAHKDFTWMICNIWFLFAGDLDAMHDGWDATTDIDPLLKNVSWHKELDKLSILTSDEKFRDQLCNSILDKNFVAANTGNYEWAIQQYWEPFIEEIGLASAARERIG